MTHTSWLNEAGQPERSDNERLEFLGDAVLDLVVSDVLMRRFPDRREGDLSRARAALVSESGLAQVALAIDLGRFILLGKGEERTGGRVASVDPGERAGGADGRDLPRRRASTPSPRSRRGCSRRGSRTWIRTRASTTSRACRSARRRCGRRRRSTRSSPRTVPITTSGSRWRCRWPGARTAARSAGRRRRRSRAPRPRRWRRWSARRRQGVSASMRARIPDDVLAVCRRLRGAGHEAHLVGGGVRDMLLGRRARRLRRRDRRGPGGGAGAVRQALRDPDRPQARDGHGADRHLAAAPRRGDDLPRRGRRTSTAAGRRR